MPCDGDTGYAKGSSPGDAALDWSGRTRSARPARMDKPLRCRPLEGQRDHRSPLRRCFKPRPPWRTGCAGFASGCRSSSERVEEPLSGGCPASCPDTYRPTRGHRHVRVWATRDIGSLRVTIKRYLRSTKTFLLTKDEDAP